jgi:hypothetical protein
MDAIAFVTACAAVACALFAVSTFRRAAGKDNRVVEPVRVRVDDEISRR